MSSQPPAPVAGTVVVVGASAGGVDALRRLVQMLPADLDATVCVVLHLSSDAPSLLSHVLAREAEIRVVAASPGAPLVAGVVYVAPPGVHLVVLDDRIELGAGPREHGHQPSVDALMRSAALAHRERVVGVVLTGMLDDGAAGLALIHRHGGAALVQDPEDAEFASMPVHALASTPQARSLPLPELARELVRLVRERSASARAGPGPAPPCGTAPYPAV